MAQRRSATDQVVLAAMRLVMGISVQAADEVGVVSAVQLRAVTVLSQRPGAISASWRRRSGCPCR